jgi:uncharacterized membrane protein
MGKALVFAAFAWPLLLAFALWERINYPAALPGISLYLAASGVCHQIAERSFHTAGVSWPVCGRCAGLYAAAPFGAWLALGPRRRAHQWSALALLALAAVPTALTVVAEWLRPPSMTNATRFIAALPLGAAIAFVIVAAGAGHVILGVGRHRVN